MRVLLAILVAAFTFSAAHAEEVTPDARYEALLTQLKGGDTSIDFMALRYAYSETAQYSPYGNPGDKKGMFAAVSAMDYDKAIMLADEILAADYLDIDAHYARMAADQKRGDGSGALFERAIALGLIRSIAESGDGKTADTAFVVIAVAEEYSYLGVNGFNVNGQSLIQSKSGPVDAMRVTNSKTKQSEVIYFNVNRPFAALGRALGSKPTP